MFTKVPRRLWLGFLGLAVLSWTAMRGGILSYRPVLFAALVGAVLLLLTLDLVITVGRLVRHAGHRLRGAAALLVQVGLLVVGGAGLTNWLLGVQAAAVLIEGEEADLSDAASLQAVDPGPLSRARDLDWRVRLAKVELRPRSGGFVPESRLGLVGHDRKASVSIGVGHPAAAGALRFHQGAFGFAPRIVVLQGERVLLDRHVPFLTRPSGGTGVAFEGAFRIEKADLDVDGAVSLDSLDADLRGHPTLALRVRRGGRPLGAGTLLPGRFADLDGGLRIGFAGLRKWSEVVVGRRNYAEWMLAGAALSLAGVVLGLVSVVRR